MKKIFVIALLASLFVSAAFAENQDLSRPKDESKWSDMTYVTAPVMKILESKDCYVVIYQKKYAGTATVTIPKSWNNFKKDTQRKHKFRSIKNIIIDGAEHCQSHTNGLVFKLGPQDTGSIKKFNRIAEPYPLLTLCNTGLISGFGS